MIDDALEYIRVEVREYLGLTNPEVIIEGLHEIKDSDENRVYISLVNIEEEKTLKNTSHYVRQNNQVQYKEPPIYLNLYLLFAFKLSSYAISLQSLSGTVEMFQHKRLYSANNDTVGNPFPANLEKLIFDFHHLTFEQLNHLWGIHGGAYFPSAMYKVRLVKVQRDEQLEGPEITKVQVDTIVN